MNILKAVETHKIISILRKVAPEQVVDTVKALYEGGIRILEITFDQGSKTCIEDTARSIRLVREAFGPELLVGAGTVLTTDQVKAAGAAGATFLLAPSVNLAVIAAAVDRGLEMIPGAFTPTEVVGAYEAGAAMVKLFPAGALGTSYLRAIGAPIGHVPLLAVGGVDENNFRDYLAAGVLGVGIGQGIANNALIKAGRFGELTALARRYTDKIQCIH